MELIISFMSDNLYYADELGSITEQIAFFDSLHFTEPSLVYDYENNHETFFCVAHSSDHNTIYSRLVRILPSKPVFGSDDSDNVYMWPRNFGNSKVLDVMAYLRNRGYSSKCLITNFTKLCVEEEDMAEDTTVGVVEMSHSED